MYVSCYFEYNEYIKCENCNKSIYYYKDLNSKYQSKYLFNYKNCKSCNYRCNNINCETSEYFKYFVRLFEL